MRGPKGIEISKFVLCEATATFELTIPDWLKPLIPDAESLVNVPVPRQRKPRLQVRRQETANPLLERGQIVFRHQAGVFKDRPRTEPSPSAG